jgi:superfamily II DNA or RNA helicase
MPQLANTDGLKTIAGEYDSHGMTELMDKPQITGDAIEHYKRLADGKQAIIYCASIIHSKHVVGAFQAAGIHAVHLDGETPKDERKEIIRKFREREIMVLSNVDLLGEGFDVPACDACIMLRPTQSTALYIQQSMRCMRYQPSKRAIIIDHVGNVTRHGLPDMEREWTLEGRKKRQREESTVKTSVCPECYCVYLSPGACPNCGNTSIKERAALAETDGELVKITPEIQMQIAKQRKKEEGICKSYADLLALAKQRGYKPGWAYMRAKARGYV